MFGFGTAKEEKIDEKIVEDKGGVVAPLEEVKEIRVQVAPEMSKIERLMAERKAAAIQSRSNSPQNNQSVQPSQPLESVQPQERLQGSLSAQSSQPTESIRPKEPPVEPVQATDPAQPSRSLESQEPPKSIESTATEYFPQQIPEKSKPKSSDISASARSSFNKAKSSTKRGSTRSKTNASISALDDLMANFGADFTSVPITPKSVENEKAVEKPALEKIKESTKTKGLDIGIG
ncbi:hypothetical protein DID88_004912 [Monilinia fructigena]|uniref:Uncharacterized protein n=1 Tax=Monilinia fructigena TaxID=38457 RepID=A0A395IQJ3_9HELO|nr:hypothetical protein DID88_004912 [Monilinia fructigena]